jgi:hypothetical protein
VPRARTRLRSRVSLRSAGALGPRTKRLAPGQNSLNICNNLGSSGVGSVAFEKAGAHRVTLRAGPARAHHRLTGGVGSRSKRPPPLNAFKPEIFFSPRASKLAARYAGGLATEAGRAGDRKLTRLLEVRASLYLASSHATRIRLAK